MLENEDWWKANDWWKTKIGGKRIWESRRNDVSADELSETKVVGKTNVGGKQKWGGDCPKSQTFLSENREPDSGLV